MNMSIADRGPAAAGYRNPNWFAIAPEERARSLDQSRETRLPLRIRLRGAMRWLGDAVMRTLSSPRVRQAGSWPRFTRDGLL